MWVLMIFLAGHGPVFHDFSGRSACAEARDVAQQAQPEAKAYCVPYERAVLGGNDPVVPTP